MLEQHLRDAALEKVISHFVHNKGWVAEPETKCLKMLWEGLFFLFWHSDKSAYQRDAALKISALYTQIGEPNTNKSQSSLTKADLNLRQQKWFETFMFSCNKHWDKVDNFRIDKFLMLMRFQFAQVFQQLKINNYDKESV